MDTSALLARRPREARGKWVVICFIERRHVRAGETHGRRAQDVTKRCNDELAGALLVGVTTFNLSYFVFIRETTFKYLLNNNKSETICFYTGVPDYY